MFSGEVTPDDLLLSSDGPALSDCVEEGLNLNPLKAFVFQIQLHLLKVWDICTFNTSEVCNLVSSFSCLNLFILYQSVQVSFVYNTTVHYKGTSMFKTCYKFTSSCVILFSRF